MDCELSEWSAWDASACSCGDANTASHMRRTRYLYTKLQVIASYHVFQNQKNTAVRSSYWPISLSHVLHVITKFISRLNTCLKIADLIPCLMPKPNLCYASEKTIPQLIALPPFWMFNKLSTETGTEAFCARLKNTYLIQNFPYCHLICHTSKWDRYFQVKLGETTSSFYKSLVGVPQGSILGPDLYNVFPYNIPQVTTMISDISGNICW